MVNSDWPSMSMKPGATTIPCASIVFFADAPARFPIAAMRPSRMPTSPEYHGEPVPSMMWPWRMTTSNASPPDCRPPEAPDVANRPKSNRTAQMLDEKPPGIDKDRLNKNHLQENFQLANTKAI